jgi:hypothetical protein
MHAMATKTIAEKLQAKNGDAVYLAGTPDAAVLVGDLPTDARSTGDPTNAQIAVVFVADSAELELQLADDLATLTGASAMWICYPKGNTTDLNRDSIRRRMAESGWEVVSNVAIDSTWSALRAKSVSAR